jgi:citrate lyase subunit beta/citryl-CoA lyase
MEGLEGSEAGNTARSGQAGRRGSDVRSDCWVSIEASGAEGIRLEVDSKVGALFGGSIRRTVEEAVLALGAEGVRVRLEDQGALPWVLQGRVEAAYRRFLETGTETGPGDARPPRTAPLPPSKGSPKDRMRRSRLYLPGNEPKFMINAGLHRPDGVILDLEDSVHPDEKDAARLLVRNALRCVDFGGAERMVRINQLPLGLEDLDSVIPEAPEMILIPKVERPEQVQEVADRVMALRHEEAVASPVWLMPILESGLGVENAFAIASASDTVAALTIGLEDYTADLGVVKTPEGHETAWARSRLVNAARAAGVQAIDSVYGDVADEEGLLAWGQRARGMGFVGMGCVHPRQIRVIHEAFAPTQLELEKALKIVAAFEDAQARGLGVVSLGTKMIDRPVVLRARKLVERAREAGLIRQEGDHE